MLEAQRRAPVLDTPNFQPLRDSLAPAQSQASLSDVTIAADFRALSGTGMSPYETQHWSYDDWVRSSALNDVQRRILESDALRKHPVRIIGPAGSGKTLLMQLLAMRYLGEFRLKAAPISILYVVHNTAMAQMVADRFRTLGAEEYMTSPAQRLTITTLAAYGQQWVGIPDNNVIDKDAQKTKQFQLEQVRAALRKSFEENHNRIEKQSKLLTQILSNDDLFSIFALLVMAEISSAISQGIFRFPICTILPAGLSQYAAHASISLRRFSSASLRR
jgi:hypothetical protein